MRAAIRDAVNDGKGNTNAEMAVANQLQKSASATEAERAAALQQALQAMLRLQEGGSQMERQLTSVLSTYGSKLSQLASTLSEHEARLNNNDAVNRR